MSFSRDSLLLNAIVLIQVAPRSASTKKTQAKHDWQDHCINCRDGGVLTCCDRCPRGTPETNAYLLSRLTDNYLSLSLLVFHPECRVLPHKSSASGSESCDQHACWDCLRGTQDAGGMLFRSVRRPERLRMTFNLKLFLPSFLPRCQTCPRAFCEDCMPEDIDPIGDILPELYVSFYSSIKCIPNAFSYQRASSLQVGSHRVFYQMRTLPRVRQRESCMVEGMAEGYRSCRE